MFSAEQCSSVNPGNAVSALTVWRQGDYTLSVEEFLVTDAWSDDGPQVDAVPVIGLVVITQTCDIVNDVPGKEYVTVCPLVELDAKVYESIRKGRSPAGAVLEHPPKPNVVVDLGRMMSLHKSLLIRFERRDGFSTDDGRMRFAETIERKHGRFAFPDVFNDQILSKLRDRSLGAHGKSDSDPGKSYRSIQTVRVSAQPNWDAQDVTVTFHFVLEPEGRREVSRDVISRTLDDHFRRLSWPTGFMAAIPPYTLETLEEMSAAQWTQTQPVDWNFISWAGTILPRGEPL